MLFQGLKREKQHQLCAPPSPRCAVSLLVVLLGTRARNYPDTRMSIKPRLARAGKVLSARLKPVQTSLRAAKGLFSPMSIGVILRPPNWRGMHEEISMRGARSSNRALNGYLCRWVLRLAFALNSDRRIRMTMATASA